MAGTTDEFLGTGTSIFLAVLGVEIRTGEGTDEEETPKVRVALSNSRYGSYGE
jgi:hypothetical protein